MRGQKKQHCRSVGAIALNISNEEGGYSLMCLWNRLKIHGFIWTELPNMEEMIARVEEIGKEDEEPLIKNGPIF